MGLFDSLFNLTQFYKDGLHKDVVLKSSSDDWEGDQAIKLALNIPHDQLPLHVNQVSAAARYIVAERLRTGIGPENYLS